MKPKFGQISNAFQLIVWQLPLKHNHSHASPMPNIAVPKKHEVQNSLSS
ncbi:hypothetical protein [Okeania sp. SIO2B3]|nr:hypothetical protein [Okeania sp. SIO2B3]NET43540.1 hypothetical protein [Okeania sp. SIO2B3]